jgi:solute carrier family 25 citrate transporter 1
MIEDSKRPQPRFNGMADAVKKIVAEEGFGGLYRGLGPVVSIVR